MLTCKDFLSELSEYLDEAVDAQARVKLEEHIAECPNCWVIADTTKKTVQIYKGMDRKPTARRALSIALLDVKASLLIGGCVVAAVAVLFFSTSANATLKRRILPWYCLWLSAIMLGCIWYTERSAVLCCIAIPVLAGISDLP